MDVDLSYDGSAFEDDLGLTDVVLDDRTARTYELEGGFDVFPAEALRDRSATTDFARPTYGFGTSAIIDDEAAVEDDFLGDDEEPAVEEDEV
jgi:DNA-directed RNA polymerase subunit beta'